MAEHLCANCRKLIFQVQPRPESVFQVPCHCGRTFEAHALECRCPHCGRQYDLAKWGKAEN